MPACASKRDGLVLRTKRQLEWLSKLFSISITNLSPSILEQQRHVPSDSFCTNPWLTTTAVRIEKCSAGQLYTMHDGAFALHQSSHWLGDGPSLLCLPYLFASSRLYFCTLLCTVFDWQRYIFYAFFCMTCDKNYIFLFGIQAKNFNRNYRHILEEVYSHLLFYGMLI